MQTPFLPNGYFFKSTHQPMKQKTLFFALTIITAFLSLNFILNPFIITGQVMDENGDPLIGASILVKGTATGTVTDIDGSFSLNVPHENVTLIVSYTGYATIEKTIKTGDRTVNFTLSEASTQLTELVVTGMGKKKRRNKKSKIASRPSIMGMAKQQSGFMMNSTVPMGHSTAPYPSPENTEDYGTINENRFFEAQQTPVSTFSIDVDAASYSNMRRFIQNGQKPPKDAVRIEEMINYFKYDYPKPADEHPFEMVAEVSGCPWQPEHQLLHVGLQGKTLNPAELPPSNVVFLLDVSGSMNTPNKLPLLKSSFKMLTNQLRPKDKVAIVVYAGAAGLVLPSTDGSNKQKILDAISELNAGGSTAGGAGIKLAYKIAKENFIQQGNNRVILATDGDFNVGVSSDGELVRLIEEERKSGIFLTVLGFGTGNLKDHKMQQLANKGNGNHAYIDSEKEAKKVLVEEFGGTMFTIAKDVKIQIEFNPAQVQGYRLIGYENRLLNKEDFNDDQKDAGELGAGHTVTALYEIIPTGIKTDYFAAVDKLKYQTTTVSTDATATNELLTIKFRYKQPDGEKSRLIEKVVENKATHLEESSENFRFAAAVAEFGLLLRDSEFKGKASYKQAAQLAKNAKGKDTNGYREELIDLIKKAERLEIAELAKE